MWSHIWLCAALVLPFLKSISVEYFFISSLSSHVGSAASQQFLVQPSHAEADRAGEVVVLLW